MDLDALREALDGGGLAVLRRAKKGERTQAALVYEAARAVLDSEEADWCAVHSWLWPNSDEFHRCIVGTGRGEDCELSEVRMVRVRSIGSGPAVNFPTQAQTLEWVRDRWPDAADPKSRALKLGEEAGEVLGAVVKMGEGRRTLADLEQETAQLVICAMSLAASAGFDLFAAVAAEYERCTARLLAEEGT